MHGGDDRFSRAIARFDALNAEDPTAVVDPARPDGGPVPAALLYGERMTVALVRYSRDAPEVVRLAARAQHLGRFRIPRTDYAPGRAGYLRWRTALGKLHARLARGILAEVGYNDATIAHVEALLRKRGLRTDPAAQMLEDVACLVFLEHYFDEFAAGQDDDKTIGILAKTWEKMSARAHREARTLIGRPGYPLRARALVEAAVER
ncbi:MAG: DUF4202 domain-containing protein [Myxococcales bacterium]|nr:DUF4202 domain-containing protein [Myxococcales bacterium]